MIVYFTGTGNSQYCAQLLADRLGDEAVDAFRFIRDGIAADLISGQPSQGKPRYQCPAYQEETEL